MNQIDKLKSVWKFPEVRPAVELDYKGGRPAGWCKPDCVNNLKKLLTEDMKVVVDGGSWKGCSASYLLEYAPNATVICVDTWQGDPNYQKPYADSLDTVYDTFCTNLWNDRDRVIPVKLSSVDGMRMLAEYEIIPDLIYVDWAHDADNVERDVDTVLDLFPTSVICGDDYSWNSVKEGLSRVCTTRNMKLLNAGEVFWRIQ